MAGFAQAKEAMPAEAMEAMLDEMKRAFEMVDTNGDGCLDREELSAMLASTGAGMSEEDV